MKFPALFPALLSLSVIGLLFASRRRAAYAAHEGAIVIIPGNIVPTGADPEGRQSLLSTPPVPLTMGTKGGNVHVRVQSALAPNRAVGVVLGIESTNDVRPTKTILVPISGEPTLEFDPRSAHPDSTKPPGAEF